MDRILIILKKENSPRASFAPALGLNTLIFKHVYWYTAVCSKSHVSVYRTIGPLVISVFVIAETFLKFLIVMCYCTFSIQETTLKKINVPKTKYVEI